MKSAIICFNCKKIKRESESYALKILDFSDLEVKEIIKPRKGKDNLVLYKLTAKEKVVRLCRTCTKRAGYKVKTPQAKPIKETPHA